MDNPPPGQALTKRLWPKGVAIPEGWQLSEVVSQIAALSYPDYVVVCGWFDPTWDDGKNSTSLT